MSKTLPQTLLQKASTFIRNFNLEMPAWGAVFSHALIDRFGNPVLQGTVEKGQVPTLTLNPAASLLNFGGASDNVNASTPTTGTTLTANPDRQNDVQYIAPAGTIAALTYVFPSDANSRIGQVIQLYSTQTVTALTITSTSLTLVGTALSAMTAHTLYSWKKVAAATWMRIA